MTEKRTINTPLIKIFFFVVLAMQFLVPNSSGDTIDDRVREISYLLMCPVCQGQTVEESNSQLAKDMRTIIRKKLQEGQSKEEIIAYFVDRYGESILGAPPAKGTNLLLWLLPSVGLAAGGIGIGLFLYRLKTNKNRNAEEKNEQPLMTDVDETYAERISEEIEKFEH